MRRPFLATVSLASACAGDFSVQLDHGSSDETSSAASESSTLEPETSAAEDPSETVADVTTLEGNSESATTTTSPDTTAADSSSSDGGCAIEDCMSCGEFEEPDTACAEAFPERPLCDVESGSCVQCSTDNASQCDGITPVCADNSCVGCTYHEQCPGSACDIDTGACFDGACVREVDGDGGETYSSISSAIADECVILLHERDGEAPYIESVDISGLTVAILAADGEHPVVQGVSGDPTIMVELEGVLYVQGLLLRGNTGAAGLLTENSTVYVDDTQILQNSAGGIVVMGGELHVRNSFVGGNGGNGFSPTTGIAADGSELEFLYTTVVFNEGDGADSFQCSATTGTLRNSIVLGADPVSFDCPGVTADHTAFDDDVAGMGNEDVSPASGSWFVNPSNDFHVTATGSAVFSAIAQWAAGDPLEDIDGTEPRPATEGAADIAGADVRP
jgi:hypothetical protein